MMNKKNLWFLTLFSLVLVLSIYYVTMPNDLLAASTNQQDKSGKTEEVNVSVEESDAISALKVENSSKTNDTLEELQDKLTNKDTTSEEKNTIYEKDINIELECNKLNELWYRYKLKYNDEDLKMLWKSFLKNRKYSVFSYVFIMKIKFMILFIVI